MKDGTKKFNKKTEDSCLSGVDVYKQCVGIHHVDLCSAFS